MCCISLHFSKNPRHFFQPICSCRPSKSGLVESELQRNHYLEKWSLCSGRLSLCLLYIILSIPPLAHFDCFTQINMQGDGNHSVVENFKHGCVSRRNAAVEPRVYSQTRQRAQRGHIDPVLMSRRPELGLCVRSAFHLAPPLSYSAGEDEGGPDGTRVRPKTRREAFRMQQVHSECSQEMRAVSEAEGLQRCLDEDGLPGMFSAKRNN